MAYVDGRLSWLEARGIDTLTEADRREFGVRAEADRTVVSVLVKFVGRDLAPLQAAGFVPRTVTESIASGEVPLASLAALRAVPQVVRMEAGRLLGGELDLSAPATGASTVRTRATDAFDGTGVLVGIIDSGIDFQHPDFRTATGSRILCLWDQSLNAQTPNPGGVNESAPAGYTYGVEYDRATIEAALGRTPPASPLDAVRHQDTADVGHGTHVAGIAAGGGRATDPSTPAGTYTGMAPGAELIIVRNATQTNDLGDSTRTLDAVKYILDKAAGENKPVVINLSQGDSGGPHDGTSLLEQGIDELLGTPGRAMVKSAGNEGGRQRHAHGRVAMGTTTQVQFTIGAGDQTAELFVLWYHGRDRLTVSVTDPGGEQSTAVAPTGAQNHVYGTGNAVRIDASTLGDPDNRDNKVSITLVRNTAVALSSGTWTIDLAPTVVQDGRFDIWVDRMNAPRASFAGAHSHDERTISIPGTAREIITVGSWVSRRIPADPSSNPVGQLAGSSSIGPTRDGRIKPELAAPGEWVMAALNRNHTLRSAAAGTTAATLTSNPPDPSQAQYQLLAGTSMAAPHVAGTTALILQRHPRLTGRQIKDGLTATAVSDAQTGGVPNTRWGYGKLNAVAAVDRAYPVPLAENWVRIQSELANWPLAAAPPIFRVFGEENGDAVIELAWDPQALLAPSASYTGADALRYYSTALDFDKTITKADGSALRVQVPAQTLTLTAGRLLWTMPAALWEGYREEASKPAPPAPAPSRRSLYMRVRVAAVGAETATVWPPDSSILNNPDAPHLGLVVPAAVGAARPPFPDNDALLQISDPLWISVLNAAWRDFDEASADRQALVRILNHSAYSGEMTPTQRARFLELWIVAGPTSRPRLDQLLDRRVWTSNTDTQPIALCEDLRSGNPLALNLLLLRFVSPHPDLVGVTTTEQLVDDVISEILDPNGQLNQGVSGMGQTTSMGALLIHVNPSEYARLQGGLLSVHGSVDLANGSRVALPPGIFQVARYGGAQGSAFTVRTNSELAFQAALLKYARGARFPEYDPAANPNASNGINTVFQETIRGGLNKAEMERGLEGLFNAAFTASATGPSDAVRNALLQALPNQRTPVLMSLQWRPRATSAGVAGHTVLALRYEGGRVFFKNPEYPGSSPPTGYLAGASRDDPPRRLDDPTQTLESMGDADLASRILWYFTPDAPLV